MNKRGFTLLEILIVLGIISIIMMLVSTIYSGVQKKSRDTKRIGDLNIIRNSLELFRTDSSYYPNSLTTTNFKNNYLKIIPSDPKSPQIYRYVSITCINDINNNKCDYLLGTILENSPKSTSSECSSYKCGGGVDCNYCLGPNGEK